MLTLNLASEIFFSPNSRPRGRLVVIEHNFDVIRCDDWVIDLGPEGGDKGGKIVVGGTPEEVAAQGRRHSQRCGSCASLPPGR